MAQRERDSSSTAQEVERLHAELIEAPQRRAAEAGFPPVRPNVDWSAMSPKSPQQQQAEWMASHPEAATSLWKRGELTAEQRQPAAPRREESEVAFEDLDVELSQSLTTVQQPRKKSESLSALLDEALRELEALVPTKPPEEKK